MRPLDTGPLEVPSGLLPKAAVRIEEAVRQNIMDHDESSGPNPVLFTRKMAKPCIFTMASHHKRVELKQLIHERGGVLEDTKFRDDDGGRIEIADRNAVNVKRTIDVFDYKYITACIESNQLRQDLKDYRINDESAFADYDPYLVLTGRVKWKDVKKADEGETCSDMDDDDDLIGIRREMASWPKSTLKSSSRGFPYNKKEQMAILHFIKRDKAFTLVKGMKLWERMETRKVCNRSAQSMAEHFKKQIMPQIRGFGLDDKDVSKFLRGFAGEEVNSSDDEESEDPPARRKDAYTPNELADMSEESDEEADNHPRSPERKTGKKKLFCQQLGLQEFTPRQTPAGRNSQLKVPSPHKDETRKKRSSHGNKEPKDPPPPVSPDENFPPVDRSADEDSEPVQSTSRGVRRGRGTLALTSDENSDDSMPTTGMATSSPKMSAGNRSVRVRKIMNEEEDESPALFVSPKRPKTSQKKQTTKSANLDLTSSSSISVNGRFYTADEDREILRFILKSNRIGEVKGNALWELMEERGVAGGRSRQSMKERFRKTISKNIDKYDDVVEDRAMRKRIKQLYLEKKSNSLDDTGSSISSGKFYTAEEDKDILKFIVENNRLDDVKGRALWELMQERGVANGRSHQSMKERFRKTISKNIEDYDDVVVDACVRIKIRYLYG